MCSSVVIDEKSTEVESQHDETIEVLRMKLKESHDKSKSLSCLMEEKSNEKYKQLGNLVSNIINTKLFKPMEKIEKLETRVNSLQENKATAEDFKILRTHVDCLANECVPAGKIKEMETKFETFLSFNSQTSTNTEEEPKCLEADILEEQRNLRQVIDLLAEDSVSADKIVQLVTLIDALNKNNVFGEYMDAELKEEAKKNLNELQEINSAIEYFGNNNYVLEKTSDSLQVYIKDMEKHDTSNLLIEELNKQYTILTAMQGENNASKRKFEQLMKKAYKSLRTNIIKIIQNLFACIQ